MVTAAIMLAHQVAAKALRDTTFLTFWPATALPLMTVGTAAFTGVLVPLFSRLLARYPPIAIVATGFGLSAAGHVLEWAWYDAGRWTAVAIYLHLAGVGSVLLSGFWSLIAERFDPAGARVSFSRIAAAGTVGGIAGSIVAERIASTISPAAVLLLLTCLHIMCGIGLLVLRRAPTLLPRQPQTDDGESGLAATLRSPYLRTIAAFVVLTSAASAILDFLLKSNASATFGTGPELLRFFSLFYGGVQVLTFVAQTRANTALRPLGIDGVLTSLPAGVATVGALALIVPAWPVITLLRAVEAVLHNSLFRSGYELLFVPMDAATRRRAKATLDVICDRVGEAAGSALVQLAVLAGTFSLRPTLLTATVVIAAAAVVVGRRFGPLYLQLIEHEVVKYHETPNLSLVSEAGWTLLQLPTPPPKGALGPSPARPDAAPIELPNDPAIAALAEMRSSDPARVTAALSDSSSFGRIHVAQVIDLLAWDAVLPAARSALEQVAPRHLGMLVDAMLNPETDFVVRRRLPRILGSVPSRRSLDELINGLEDQRFEVRYHCSRAITRILARNPELSVDPARIIAVVERELAVPPQRWRGYTLLDRPELDGPTDAATAPEHSSAYLEYLTLLLSTFLGREPLDAAVQGVQSDDAGVRGLALEYLDQVLPPAVLERLTALIASTSSASGAPGQSGEPPAATRLRATH
jgi:hypothetical protein